MNVKGIIKDLKLTRSIKRTRRKVNWDVWALFNHRYVIKDELTITLDDGELLVLNALNGEALYANLEEAKDKGWVVTLNAEKP